MILNQIIYNDLLWQIDINFDPDAVDNDYVVDYPVTLERYAYFWDGSRVTLPDLTAVGEDKEFVGWYDSSTAILFRDPQTSMPFKVKSNMDLYPRRRHYGFDVGNIDPNATPSGDKSTVFAASLDSAIFDLGDVYIDHSTNLYPTTIARHSFANMVNLKSMELNSGVTTIQDGVNPYGADGNTAARGAFYNSSIEALRVPDSVTYIGDFAFEYCDNIVHVSRTSGGFVASHGNAKFHYCGFTEMTFPEIFDEIHSLEFAYSSIEKLYVTHEINRIYGDSFYQVPNFLELWMYQTDPPILGAGLQLHTGLTIYVPAEALTTYQTEWTLVSSQIQAMPS